jgi:FtsH-binding integral membrane protein
VLRQGPIPAFVHGVIEYAGAILLIAAPFLLSFDSGTATAVSIVVGVLVLILAASSAMSTGLIKSIPVPTHIVLDFLVVAALIASPFLFGFSGDGTATAFFIAVGVLHLLVTIATRFIRDRPAGGSHRTRPSAPRP